MTKSLVYAIVRESINYKKHVNDTTDVTSHVEDAGFESIIQYINKNADRIILNRSDRQETSVAAHLDRLNYLFRLPSTLEEEYEYCLRRNNGKRNL